MRARIMRVLRHLNLQSKDHFSTRDIADCIRMVDILKMALESPVLGMVLDQSDDDPQH